MTDAGPVATTGLLALALVLLPATYRWVRLFVTIVHEGGHAVVAVLVGRRLQGIRVHSDTSGLTVTKGRPRGPGMVAMLAAGYVAPALAGLLAAVLVAGGRHDEVLWLLVGLTAPLVLLARNAYGLLALVALGGGTAAVVLRGDPDLRALAAYLVTWLLLLAAPRPLVELLGRGRTGRRGSDPDQLARLTHVPGVLWIWLFLLVNLTGLAVGLGTLVGRFGTG